MLPRNALLCRIHSSAPAVWRFLRDGLVCSGASWVGCPALLDPEPLPQPTRVTRQEVRRGLEEIERYLAAHV